MSEEQIEENIEEVSAPHIEEEVEVSVEDRARLLGWKPPEEFNGDPEHALTAEDFVKKGEEILPVVRANNKKLEAALYKQNQEISELKGVAAGFNDILKMQEDRIRKEYEKDMRDAVRDGDIERFDELSKERDEYVQKSTPPPVNKDAQIEANNFMARNDWFGVDDVKTKFAEQEDKRLASLGLPPAEHFARLEENIKRKFTKSPPPQGVSPGKRAVTAPKKKDFASMPDENKQMAMTMEKYGKVNREEYAKNYWASQE